MLTATSSAELRSKQAAANGARPLTTEAEQIEQEMRQVRAELRDDVREIVTSARIMGEWQYYVGRYPWVCVGLAAAAGFFLVPARPVLIHPDAKTLLELAKANKLEIKMETPAAKRPSLLAGLMGAVSATAVQGAMAVANHVLQDLVKPAGGPPEPRAGASR